MNDMKHKMEKGNAAFTLFILFSLFALSWQTVAAPSYINTTGTIAGSTFYGSGAGLTSIPSAAISSPPWITDDTSVPKNHITNSGTLPFDWSDAEVSDTLTASDVVCTDCIGATEISDVYLLNTGDTATGNYNFDSNTLSIDATGNLVGIGVASPVGKLQVNGSLTTTGFSNVLTSVSGTELGYISNKGILRVGNSGTLQYEPMSYEALNHTFLVGTAGGTTGMTISSTGTVTGVAFSGPLACTDCIALGTETSGNYIGSLTAGAGISVGAAGEGTSVTVTNTGDTDASNDITTSSAWTGGDLSGTGLAATVAANSVALGTDTTGGYAASSTEGGSATNALACSGDTVCDVTSVGLNSDGANYFLGGGVSSGIQIRTWSETRFAFGANSLASNISFIDGRIIVGTGTAGSATGQGDVYVTSDVEVDGNLYVDGQAYGVAPSMYLDSTARMGNHNCDDSPSTCCASGYHLCTYPEFTQGGREVEFSGTGRYTGPDANQGYIRYGGACSGYSSTTGSTAALCSYTTTGFSCVTNGNCAANYYTWCCSN